MSEEDLSFDDVLSSMGDMDNPEAVRAKMDSISNTDPKATERPPSLSDQASEEVPTPPAPEAVEAPQEAPEEVLEPSELEPADTEEQEPKEERSNEGFRKLRLLNNDLSRRVRDLESQLADYKGSAPVAEELRAENDRLSKELSALKNRPSTPVQETDKYKDLNKRYLDKAGQFEYLKVTQQDVARFANEYIKITSDPDYNPTDLKDLADRIMVEHPVLDGRDNQVVDLLRDLASIEKEAAVYADEYQESHQQEEYHQLLDQHIKGTKVYSDEISHLYELTDQVRSADPLNMRRILATYVSGSEEAKKVKESAVKQAIKAYAPPRPIKRSDYSHMSEKEAEEEIRRAHDGNIETNEMLKLRAAASHVDTILMSRLLRSLVVENAKMKRRLSDTIQSEPPAGEATKPVTGVTKKKEDQGFGDDLTEMFSKYENNFVKH